MQWKEIPHDELNIVIENVQSFLTNNGKTIVFYEPGSKHALQITSDSKLRILIPDSEDETAPADEVAEFLEEEDDNHPGTPKARANIEAKAVYTP